MGTKIKAPKHAFDTNRNAAIVGSCCFRLYVAKRLNGFKHLAYNSQQHATTCNNMQKGVQMDATCIIQQCCVRLHLA